jgi:heterodisulfide reductase subunit C
MNLLSQLIFILIILFFVIIIRKRALTIRRNILLGKKEHKVTTNKKTRIRNLILIAFGQQKMFKKFIPAFLHLFLYIGFIIINIEILEILIDGIIGNHRTFAVLGLPYYNIFISFIEFLVVTVLISCTILLIRRNLLGIKRFKSIDLKGWPVIDANIILIIEIVLMIAILTMNSTDLILQNLNHEGYIETGNFYFSNKLIFLFMNFSPTSLVLLERVSWWIHIILIFSFAVYITYSKHLHIFLAFPNIYYSKDDPLSKIENMPSITNEIKSMMGQETSTNVISPTRFGAKDIEDLSWKNILEAYSCSECGRCTSECPANITGKKLSPRKIMMDVRDRAEEVGKSLDNKKSTNTKSLFSDYISKEEIFACTSCNACVEACPININPLEIILELRRFSALEESSSPSEWNAMFQNIETNYSPWKFPIDDRFNWSKE